MTGIQDQEGIRRATTDLGQKSSSTAYIDDIQASEDASGIRVCTVITGRFEKFVSEKIHADRVHFVKVLKLAMFVPPVGGESGKVGYLLGIDRGGG